MLAEVDRLRARLLPAPVAPPPPRGPAGAAFVGRVASSSNGLGAGKFVKVNPVLVTGAESEGGSATETVDTGVSQLVYLLRGTAATDDDLVCYRVPHRWVAAKKAPAATGTQTITVIGCGGSSTPVSGVSVTLAQSGTTVASGTTDSAGHVSFAVAAGTYDITYSKARFTTTTETAVAITTGTWTHLFNISPYFATGYTCGGAAWCADPTPTTLFLSDGINPTVTLNLSTFDMQSTGWTDGNGWAGCGVRTINASIATTDCAGSTTTAKTVPAVYHFEGVTGTSPFRGVVHLRMPKNVGAPVSTDCAHVFPLKSSCIAFNGVTGPFDSGQNTVSNCTPGSFRWQVTFTTEASVVAGNWASVYGANTSVTLTITE